MDEEEDDDEGEAVMVVAVGGSCEVDTGADNAGSGGRVGNEPGAEPSMSATGDGTWMRGDGNMMGVDED